MPIALACDHKRVYRIYRDLELNLRIRMKKRMVREKPEALTVPQTLNLVWSMDFMHDQFSDGWCIRLFNLIMTSTGKPWPSTWIFLCRRCA